MSSNQVRRPTFYEGQYLGAADLTTAIDYGRIKDARHALGAHTWGIAAGLEITENDSAAGGGQVDVFIQPGYAWDGFGRPIVVLTPTKIPAEFFRSIVFDASQDGQTTPGRRIKVWLRYDESATQAPGPGFERCGSSDQFARIGETFRIEIGEQQEHAGHAPISVAGHSVDAKDVLQKLDPRDPPVELFDESIPYQDFPTDNPRARWFIPLGEVRWLPNSIANLAGNFVKRNAADLASSRSLRRHVGVVAAAVEAAAGLVRLRDRTKPYSTVVTSDPELVWVEGHLRVEGDARLFKGKLEFRDQTGLSNNADPLFFSRRDATGASSLQAVIGEHDSGANTFVVGPLKSGNIAPKLTVRDNGRIGMGTDAPDRKVTIEDAGDAFLNIKAHGGTEEILIGADANGGIVSTMTNHDLHLRAGNNNDRMIIKADGKVGIGTNTPITKLEVAGEIALETVPSTVAPLPLPAGTTMCWNDGTWLRLNQNRNFDKPILGVHTPGVFSSGSLNIGGAGGWGDPGGGNVWITGRVGIGTTTPALALDVQGDFGRPNGPATVHLFGARIGDVGGAVLFVRAFAGGVVAFDGINNRVGIGTASPAEPLHVRGNLQVEGNAFRRFTPLWDVISDERLKEDISPLENALSKLLQLRGVMFRWKDQEQVPDAGPQAGLIAQEVEKVMPEWVITTSTGHKAVSLKGFEALIIESLRELKSAVDGLTERLDKLEAQPTTAKKKKPETQR